MGLSLTVVSFCQSIAGLPEQTDMPATSSTASLLQQAYTGTLFELRVWSSTSKSLGKGHLLDTTAWHNLHHWGACGQPLLPHTHGQCDAVSATHKSLEYHAPVPFYQLHDKIICNMAPSAEQVHLSIMAFKT